MLFAVGRELSNTMVICLEVAVHRLEANDDVIADLGTIKSRFDGVNPFLKMLR